MLNNGRQSFELLYNVQKKMYAPCFLRIKCLESWECFKCWGPINTNRAVNQWKFEKSSSASVLVSEYLSWASVFIRIHIGKTNITNVKNVERTLLIPQMLNCTSKSILEKILYPVKNVGLQPLFLQDRINDSIFEQQDILFCVKWL